MHGGCLTLVTPRKSDVRDLGPLRFRFFTSLVDLEAPCSAILAQLKADIPAGMCVPCCSAGRAPILPHRGCHRCLGLRCLSCRLTDRFILGHVLRQDAPSSPPSRLAARGGNP